MNPSRLRDSAKVALWELLEKVMVGSCTKFHYLWWRYQWLSDGNLSVLSVRSTRIYRCVFCLLEWTGWARTTRSDFKEGTRANVTLWKIVRQQRARVSSLFFSRRSTLVVMAQTCRTRVGASLVKMLQLATSQFGLLKLQSRVPRRNLNSQSLLMETLLPIKMSSTRCCFAWLLEKLRLWGGLNNCSFFLSCSHRRANTGLNHVVRVSNHMKNQKSWLHNCWTHLERQWSEVSCQSHGFDFDFSSSTRANAGMIASDDWSLMYRGHKTSLISGWERQVHSLYVWKHWRSENNFLDVVWQLTVHKITHLSGKNVISQETLKTNT